MLMHRVASFLAGFLVILSCANLAAQTAPATPDRPWTSPDEQQIQTQNHNLPAPNFVVDPNKAYSLSELVDLAQQHNPETRFAWERAKSQAAALGIAKSEWYPVLGALASGEVDRNGLLFNTNYVRQTTSTSELAFTLNYAILDFGRSPRIQQAAAQLLATDFEFNDTHRKVIYQVEQAYYRVLSTAAQQTGCRSQPGQRASGASRGRGSTDEWTGDSSGCSRGAQRHGTGAVRFAIGDRLVRNRPRRPCCRAWYVGVCRGEGRARHVAQHSGER